MLAKVIAHGADRDEALDRARRRRSPPPASTASRPTSGCCAPSLAAPERARRAAPHRRRSRTSPTPSRASRCVRAGTLTTVQDWPGRTGLWHVGVPPSGPMDDLSFRLGNRALGNPEGAPGLECTLAGPGAAVQPPAPTVCVTGAPARGHARRRAGRRSGSRSTVPAGGVAGRRRRRRPGLRTYLLVAGGLDVPQLPRQRGDVHARPVRRPRRPRAARRATCCAGRRRGRDAARRRPRRPTARRSRSAWQIGVARGPARRAGVLHAERHRDVLRHRPGRSTSTRPAPASGSSARKPTWARPDGGEAGPAPVEHPRHPVRGRRRRLHRRHADPARPRRPVARRLRLPGDGRRRPALEARPAAPRRHRAVRAGRRGRGGRAARRARDAPQATRTPTTTAASSPARTPTPTVTYRRSGDDNLLVEYGADDPRPGLRMRVHALARARLRRRDGLRGIVDLTPGIRSLQVHVDPDRAAAAQGSSTLVREIEDDAARHRRDLVVPSRTVHLPLSLGRPGHPRGHRALHGRGPRRRAVVPVEHRVHPPDQRPGLGRRRATAPSSTPSTWCSASATSTSARRRHAARPAAPPGHHQVQPGPHLDRRRTRSASAAPTCASTAWRAPAATSSSAAPSRSGTRYARHGPFEPGTPWLLRFFDRIVWYPVGADELLDLRADMAAGRLDVAIEDGHVLARRPPAVPGRERRRHRRVPRPAGARRSPPSARRGRRPASSTRGPSPPPRRAAGRRVEVPAGGVLVEAPFVGERLAGRRRPGRHGAARADGCSRWRP